MSNHHRGGGYRKWRISVLRNGYHKYYVCGVEDELTADHIKPRVSHPELFLDVSNGRILCNTCRVRDMLDSLVAGKFDKRV